MLLRAVAITLKWTECARQHRRLPTEETLHETWDQGRIPGRPRSLAGPAGGRPADLGRLPITFPICGGRIPLSAGSGAAIPARELPGFRDRIDFRGRVSRLFPGAAGSHVARCGSRRRRGARCVPTHGARHHTPGRARACAHGCCAAASPGARTAFPGGVAGSRPGTGSSRREMRPVISGPLRFSGRVHV